jgi:hypothetical protein
VRCGQRSKKRNVLLSDKDIKREKMNIFRQIINEYRIKHNEELLESYKSKHNGKDRYGESFDVNYWHRKKLIFELYNDYSIEDKPLIKWLLKEELRGFKFDIPVQTTDLCAFMLFKYMNLEDIYDLFEAKFGAGTDNQCFVDIELVFGFDKEQTKTYLTSKKTNKRQNKEILKAIKHYEDNPKAKFKSREEYINYFETKKINFIKSDLESYDDYEE